jgi:23S rRNA (pseudouridine1915-N3)-methyltransferase
MKVLIIAVGKESSPPVMELQQEYERRLKPYASIEWKLLPSSRHSEKTQARDEESSLIINQLKSTDNIILLDERGQQQDNKKLATTFERFAGAHGRTVIVIGGAFGVNDVLRNRASFVWSLSSLVFPHQLVRIMLLEQIYRTYMVLANHPYHHD